MAETARQDAGVSQRKERGAGQELRGREAPRDPRDPAADRERLGTRERKGTGVRRGSQDHPETRDQWGCPDLQGMTEFRVTPGSRGHEDLPD